ncbi:MAG: hypothetical protein E7L01_25925 [Paenibacillus macerans]|uniref:Uncharacterized protein n=1 Tax=Paenibacillus macerans TaxID=44252 RepID=A0A090Z9R6_PAEMA|nr:hypothetical protein [Paenibacillus macerans]KFN06965.1 hypothetical protein DJ90_4637 [Paenibacillus macerans]MBS5914484.1 hypothetical protein [Paenibacillus macerans]MCY7559701.1 hypothetical protein [Paenibacillus macerans]MDU7476752.1 hypothetical protein [Paenibacillus macerans]MEC0136249.1 hypothetical protein [Paenibacillus macerans]
MNSLDSAIGSGKNHRIALASPEIAYFLGVILALFPFARKITAKNVFIPPAALRKYRLFTAHD